MPRVGFEPTLSTGERPKTYALDRAATGTGVQLVTVLNTVGNCNTVVLLYYILIY